MKVVKKINIVVLIVSCMLFAGCRTREELLVVQTTGEEEAYIASAVAEEPPRIAVYVCGQVECPGVVYLSEDARVVDAVEAAGGLSEDADAEYINLAARVSDGEKLYIPDRQEGLALREQDMQRLSGLVNINRADAEQLMTLPGIGESKARDIIAYRDAHGAFTRIEDLMKVSGIKESLFLKVKERIVVE